MIKWCIISNTATGPAADWLRNPPGITNMPGVCHDGSNTVYAHLPPDIKLVDPFIVPQGLTLPDLVMTVGSFLAAKTNRVLIASESDLRALFKTPHHRLWCGNYETWNELEKDHEIVFKVGVDGRTPLDQLKAESRDKIFNLVTKTRLH